MSSSIFDAATIIAYNVPRSGNTATKAMVSIIQDIRDSELRVTFADATVPLLPDITVLAQNIHPATSINVGFTTAVPTRTSASTSLAPG